MGIYFEVLLCCDNNFHSPAKAFQLISECGCGDFWSFSQKSISEVKHRCQARRPGAQSVFPIRAKVSATCVLPRQPSRAMSSQGSFCTRGHCHAGTSSDPLVPVEGYVNATACKDIFVWPILWQQFREEPYTARCPHGVHLALYCI